MQVQVIIEHDQCESSLSNHSRSCTHESGRQDLNRSPKSISKSPVLLSRSSRARKHKIAYNRKMSLTSTQHTLRDRMTPRGALRTVADRLPVDSQTHISRTTTQAVACQCGDCEKPSSSFTAMYGWAAYIKLFILVNTFNILLADVNTRAFLAAVVAQNILLLLFILRGDPYTLYLGPKPSLSSEQFKTGAPSESGCDTPASTTNITSVKSPTSTSPGGSRTAKLKLPIPLCARYAGQSVQRLTDEKTENVWG